MFHRIRSFVLGWLAFAPIVALFVLRWGKHTWSWDGLFLVLALFWFRYLSMMSDWSEKDWRRILTPWNRRVSDE